MGMASTGLVRAEGQVVTSTLSTDLVLIQRIDSTTGQYSPREITVTNFISGTPGGYTPTAVLFANSLGDISADSTNLSFNDSTFTLSTVHINAGASATAGDVSIFPTTAAKGKLLFSAADSAGNTTTTITNASQAGARTYTLPDAGASASFVMSEGAQTVNGVKTFGSVPIGTAETVSLTLPTITALAGAAKIIFVAPYAGTITNGRAAIDGAITASDITIALRINTSAVTSGGMTVANSGSGFGTKATCSPSAANTFVAGDVINATITGGVGTVGGAINVYITRTA